MNAVESCMNKFEARRPCRSDRFLHRMSVKPSGRRNRHPVSKVLVIDSTLKGCAFPLRLESLEFDVPNLGALVDEPDNYAGIHEDPLLAHCSASVDISDAMVTRTVQLG